VTSIREHIFHLDSPGQSMSIKEQVFIICVELLTVLLQLDNSVPNPIISEPCSSMEQNATVMEV
jgi:hypothetical protein